VVQVILIDVNILVHASHAESDQNAPAHNWLDQQLNGSVQVGMPWHSLLGFLRIATNSRAFQRPLTMATAWQQVMHWLTADVVWVPAPTERHAEILGNLLAQLGVQGNLVPDAHLAALAIEHGLTLCSTDGDFARFPELRWLNPIAR
jgi:toxin-antitoxin system PIN domain toxin